jgi:hypothetical protein
LIAFTSQWLQGQALLKNSNPTNVEAVDPVNLQSPNQNSAEPLEAEQGIVTTAFERDPGKRVQISALPISDMP